MDAAAGLRAWLGADAVVNPGVQLACHGPLRLPATARSLRGFLPVVNMSIVQCEAPCTRILLPCLSLPLLCSGAGWLAAPTFSGYRIVSLMRSVT